MLTLSPLMTPKTSAHARENLAMLEAEQAQAREELERYRAQRDALLVSDDADAIEAGEAQAIELHRYLDRLEAGARMLTETETRLREAERIKDAKALHRKARKAMDRGVEILTEYKGHAEAIAGLINETGEIHRLIDQAAKAAEAVGIDVGDLDYPYAHKSLNAPEHNETERVYTGEATETYNNRHPTLYQGGDNRPPERDHPGNWKTVTTKHTPEKRGLNLASPGYQRGIRLPDVDSGEWIVDQR